ncbi:Rhodanese-like/PpiC domain-containing protein 12 chloroplastic [Bienertia sinuspersici]
MLSRASYSHHHLPSIAFASSLPPFSAFKLSFNLLHFPVSSSISSSKHPQKLQSESFRFSTSSSFTSIFNIANCFHRIPSLNFSVPSSSSSFSSTPAMLGRPSFKGEDLSDLAVEHSICPSKEEGGVLGWVRRGQMVPEFEEAAFSAPLDTVVRCKTNFGWHLLQVLSEREGSLLGEIQPNELHERLQDPSFTGKAQLIDVREPEEVSRASLPGFQVLPLQQFGSWGPEIMTKFDPEKDTYVMCHHGVRSMQVAKWLQSQGFKKVFNVKGGIHAYAVNVDPSVPTY